MALKPKTIRYERRRRKITVKVQVTYLRDKERLDRAVQIALDTLDNPLTPLPKNRPR